MFKNKYCMKNINITHCKGRGKYASGMGIQKWPSRRNVIKGWCLLLIWGG